MVLRALLVVLFLMMSVGFTGAQQTEKSAEKKNISPPKFRVQVRVSEDLKTEAESYIKRELRSLGDVEVTDMLAHYELSVIILEHISKSSGTKTGQISCSFLGVKRFDVLGLTSKLPSEQFSDVFVATSDLYYYPNLFVLIINGERTKLKQLCQEIVANFDTKLLEPDRQKR